MSSVDSFSDFIQAGDAAGLQVFMTNEIPLQTAHRLERNNRALYDACRVGFHKISEVLISFGADANYFVNEPAPLRTACYNAHPACVDVLLAHGADANFSTLSHGITPLMSTAVRRDIPVGLTLDQFIDNRCRCMRSLLNAGAAIDQKANDGYSALMYATWNFRLTEILVKEGADVNILNNNRNSSLHYACEGNDSNIVVMLFERGADIDAVNWCGRTPLHWACHRLYPTVVDILLHHCADIDIVDNNGDTALQGVMSRPASSNRVAVLQLMATCAQTRLEESSADWIRLARNERSRPQMALGSWARPDNDDVSKLIN